MQHQAYNQEKHYTKTFSKLKISRFKIFLKILFKKIVFSLTN